mgnify:CR=1 FL=1
MTEAAAFIKGFNRKMSQKKVNSKGHKSNKNDVYWSASVEVAKDKGYLLWIGV